MKYIPLRCVSGLDVMHNDNDNDDGGADCDGETVNDGVFRLLLLLL